MVFHYYSPSRLRHSCTKERNQLNAWPVVVQTIRNIMSNTIKKQVKENNNFLFRYNSKKLIPGTKEGVSAALSSGDCHL